MALLKMQESHDYERKQLWYEHKVNFIAACLTDMQTLSQEARRTWIVAIAHGYQLLVGDGRRNIYDMTFIINFSNFFYKNIEQRPELAKLIEYGLVDSTIKSVFDAI